MSLEAWGDSNPDDDRTEQLIRAMERRGWESNEDGTMWRKAADEEWMPFAEAAASMEDWLLD